MSIRDWLASGRDLLRQLEPRDRTTWIVTIRDTRHAVRLVGAIDGMLPTPGTAVLVDDEVVSARFDPLGGHGITTQGAWRFSIDGHDARLVRQMIDLQVPVYLLEVPRAQVAQATWQPGIDPKALLPVFLAIIAVAVGIWLAARCAVAG